MSNLSGQVIRGYELRDLIDQGGFGAVYRAYQTAVERDVAIKIILPAYANEPEFIRRFEAEAQIVARLEHPYIVPLYDYWREPGGAYLVMRWLRGGSVRRSLEKGAWTPERTARLLNQIASALAVAHRAGLVHRDIKTDNLLLDEDNNAYLADFGIAKDALTDKTRADIILGSPDYMSPEQFLGDPLTPQSDIYSLGIVLFEMLSGAKPFKEATVGALRTRQLNDPLPSLHERNPNLPASLDTVIQRATRKIPAERYESTLEMAAAFRQALNETADAATRILSQEDDLSSVASGLENPYKGLRAFQTADAEDFFGRDALITAMLKQLSREDSGGSFLAVVGPSGSGKSSVVKAGLIPALRKGALPGSENWFIVEMTPGAHPFEELEIALLRVATQTIASLSDQLSKDERGLLTSVKRVLPEPNSELLLVIDQFEELFTQLTDEAIRKHFLDSLLTAVTDPTSQLRVIVTLRGDFYDRPLLYSDFGRLFRVSTEVVLPLTPEELQQAILNPAKRVGLRLEPGLVDAVVNDIGSQPGTLPLLQYALTELYNQREGNLLTLKAYRDSGGVMGALSRRAEQLYNDLDPAGQRVARQLFLRLVTLGEGTEDTRRRVRQDELMSLVGNEQTIQTVIDQFVKYRLLTFDRDPITRGPTVEVAHEALIRNWATLRGWIDASRDDLRIQRLLITASDEWQRAGFDTSYLASGTRLTQFEEWAARGDLSLSQQERNYLEASVAERKHVEAAKQAALEKERLLERRGRNRLRTLVVVLLLATVGAFALSAFALNQRQLAIDNAATATSVLGEVENARATSVAFAGDAQTQAALAANNAATATFAQGQAFDQAEIARVAQATAVRSADESQSMALASGSEQALSAGNFDLAMALALQANTVDNPPEQASLALVDAAAFSWSINRWHGHTDWVSAVTVDSSGTRALSASPDHTMILWDVASGQVIRQFPVGDSRVMDVAFLPDGIHALAGYQNGKLALWNIDDGSIERQFAGHDDIITAVAVNAQGTQALTASFDTTVKLWNLATGDLIETLSGNPAQVLDVAFSPDGQMVLSGAYNGALILWDLKTGSPLRQFAHGSSPVWGVAISPDGQTALSGTDDGDVTLWDVSSGQIIRRMTGHSGQVTDVAYSPDGNDALSASQDTTLRLWDLGTGTSIRTLRGHTALIDRAVYLPDGKHALSASQDTTLRLWDVSTDTPLRPAAGSAARSTDDAAAEAHPPQRRLAADAHPCRAYPDRCFARLPNADRFAGGAAARRAVSRLDQPRSD